jgi:hypothetical protein
MLKIYKYPLQLTDEQVVQMPGGAKILSTALDPRGNLCVWALVNPELEMVDRLFMIIGTGNPTPDCIEWAEFVGTVRQEVFMWHVFWRTL